MRRRLAAAVLVAIALVLAPLFVRRWHATSRTQVHAIRSIHAGRG